MHFAQRSLDVKAKAARLFSCEDVFARLLAAGEGDENVSAFKANGGRLGNKIGRHFGNLSKTKRRATPQSEHDSAHKLEGVFI